MLRYLNVSKLFLLLIWFCACSVESAQKAIQCNNDAVHEIDTLIHSILPFNRPKVKPPERPEDIPAFCQHYGGVVDRIEDINKRCMKDTYRNIVNLVIYNIRKSSSPICSKRALASRDLNSKQATFLQMSKCVNSGAGKLERCAKTAKLHMVAIENAPKRQRISLLCCEVLTLRKCIIGTLSKEPGCSGKEADFKNTAENLGAGALNLACAGFDTEAACRTLKVPKKKKSQKVPKSFVVPVLNILDSV